ncbi:MAG: flagellar hook-basal body complex protein FliE [Melioribacteraceae bacterium]|jgi:flagellar hook-basal body complex protein FliE|nr:flagellar hook-basal body complex protein FliE [Melioribacteraceae bacterium]
MKTGGLGNFLPKFPTQNTNSKEIKSAGFENVLGDFVKGVNTDQLDSKQIVTDFIEGKDVELHEVMIAGQKARTSLELLMQIRNQTVDMYKELTRMQ